MLRALYIGAVSEGKAIVKDGPVWALGAMSGTSLDGIDAAMVLTDGRTIFEFGETAYRPYSEPEKQILRAALGKWQGVKQATEIVENAHAELLSGFADAQLIGFHGQTLAHDPANRRTFQAGNGALLAEVLGISVVWDFRSTDVEMGGQGAPLAPFFHFACAKLIDAKEPLLFLNLGGIGNLTWIDPQYEDPDLPGAILAFDTGPANAPLNDLMQDRLSQPFDNNGELARQGRADAEILERFLEAAYFHRVPPKSLDRGDFADLSDAVAALSDADAAATLTAAAASAITKAGEHFPGPISRILVGGGGRLNSWMMELIAAAQDVPVVAIEEVGLDGDMLEAQAFAHLAVRVTRGLPTSCTSTTGVSAAIGGGRISHPANLR